MSTFAERKVVFSKSFSTGRILYYLSNGGNFKRHNYMKGYTLTLCLLFIHVALNAQINIGYYDSTFYHVNFTPNYIVKDTVYDSDYNHHNVLIDLDNDGNNDLSINSVYDQKMGSGGPGLPFYYPYWESSITVLNDSLKVVSVNNTNADTLTSIDSISVNSNWGSNNYFNLAFSINNYTVDSTWKDKAGYFIGFEIIKPQDTLLGWFQFDIEGYHIIKLVEFACQSHNPKDTTINLYENPAKIKQIIEDVEVITILPNPFQENLHIFSSKKGIDIKHVELYSLAGKLLISKEVFSGNCNIDTSKLINGVFILKVYLTDNSIVNRKVIK